MFYDLVLVTSLLVLFYHIVALDRLAIGTLLLQGRLIFLVASTIIVLVTPELICREERFLGDHNGNANR
ncbi:MAG: hypothetical protein KDB03_15310, partial [Planctomycetales bacterium]|nr:hypothetical protein [Planctomycetales bacterium]